MLCEIELHDSELLHVDPESGTVLIDAWVHRSGTNMRRDGGSQRVLLRFKDLRIESKASELSGDIYDWTITSDSLPANGLIPLPFETANPIAIQISFRGDGSEAVFHGDALAVTEAGPYRFVQYWRD